MADDSRRADDNFLRRWSQRKLAAARQAAEQSPAPAPANATAPAAGATNVDATAGPPATSGVAAAPAAARDGTPDLPSIDSLDFDSDFTRFLSSKVDESVRRKALRKLFGDPRFNVMDGLDVYIDDYSKFEPIPDDLIGKLAHARYVFDPPSTRVNEAGHVEDVPDPTPAEAASDDPGAGGAAAPTAPDRIDAPMAEAPPEAAPDAAPEVGQSVDARPNDVASVPAGDAGRVRPVPEAVERGKPR